MLTKYASVIRMDETEKKELTHNVTLKPFVERPNRKGRGGSDTSHLEKYKFKPGNKLGHGRKKFPADVRIMRNMTAADYVRILAKYLRFDREMCIKAKDDPATPMLELAVISCINKILKTGDFNHLEQMMSRIVGRVPDRIQLDADVNGSIGISTISTAELMNRFAQRIKLMRDSGVLNLDDDKTESLNGNA